VLFVGEKEPSSIIICTGFSVILAFGMENIGCIIEDFVVKNIKN
jgi:hypothetical protein